MTDSGWPNRKRIHRGDERSALPPFRYSPEWWPDPNAWWVWADRAAVNVDDTK